jgi:hypothetical protein
MPQGSNYLNYVSVADGLAKCALADRSSENPQNKVCCSRLGKNTCI